MDTYTGRSFLSSPAQTHTSPSTPRVVGSGVLVFLKSGSEFFLECSSGEAKALREWRRAGLVPPPFLEEKGVDLDRDAVACIGDPKAVVSLATLPVVQEQAPEAPLTPEEKRRENEEDLGIADWTDEQVQDVIDTLSQKRDKTAEDSVSLMNYSAALIERKKVRT